MVPDTALGLALFVALLAPGFVYLQRRERHHPGIDYSTLRETSFVVLASISSIGTVVCVFGLLRVIPVRLFPDSWIPDVGAYVRGGEKYARVNYVEAFVWLAMVIGLGCAGTAVAAIPPMWLVRREEGRWREWVVRRRGPGPIDQQSGWGLAFSFFPDSYKSVFVELADGSALHGHMLSRSPQLEENGDRDMLLAAPLSRRCAPLGEWERIDEQVAVISSSKITYFLVNYSQNPLI